MLETEVAHEARWVLTSINRGFLTEKEARELIAVNAEQALHLRRVLGAQAELVIENRLMILQRFEELLKESQRPSAAPELRVRDEAHA
jgi:hypothetical protein